MRNTRREFLVGAGTAGVALALAACGGSSTSSSSTSAAASTPAASTGGATTAALESAELSFTLWGGDPEIASYKSIIEKFQTANPGVTVKLENVPYDQINAGIDARLQAGKGPDLFRTTYNDIGFYGKEGGLQDLSQHLSADFGAAFNDALWGAVAFDGKAYGVPQHTDVSALVYNKSLMTEAEITDIPTSLDTAWSWERFVEVCSQIRAKTGAFPFAMNWQLFGCYRWMNWLYAAGGTMLTDGKPSLSGAAGEKTLALFKTWRDGKFFPPTAGPKGPGYPDELFPAGKLAMISAGDFLVPSLADTVKKFEWGVTYLPKDVAAATDLGGTAVVVSKDCKSVAQAAAFAQFLVTEDNQKLFCEQTGTLPTLKSLATQQLAFAVRPDVMPVYLQQATTLPADLVKAVSLPNFTKVNEAMTKELDAFLNSGQSSGDTLRHMDDAVAQIL